MAGELHPRLAEPAGIGDGEPQAGVVEALRRRGAGVKAWRSISVPLGASTPVMVSG